MVLLSNWFDLICCNDSRLSSCLMHSSNILLFHFAQDQISCLWSDHMIRFKLHLFQINFRSYKLQVLSAAASPPCETFSFFLAKLLLTVRSNIGECAAASYRTLTIDAASDILMFHSREVSAFLFDLYLLTISDRKHLLLLLTIIHIGKLMEILLIYVK